MIRSFLSISSALVVGAAGTLALPDTDLNDLEMAHVAVTANNTDIAYAHLALALSSDPEIREFAQTMIRDHGAVNEQIARLASKLGVTAQDNELSRSMAEQSKKVIDELSQLRGKAFDKRYVENEAAYHQLVNGVVADNFIPNIQNKEVKAAFESALEIFLVHQKHAERLSSARM